jgi:Family of unknown function (DUF5723)
MRGSVIFAGLVAIVSTFPAIAQVETTAYLMNSLPQYVNSNPAFVPKYKFALGLPVISSFAVGYTNNGFTYNDLIKKENGKLIADLSNWAKQLPDKTYIASSFQTDLFRLGVRISPKMYLTLNSTAKGYARTLIPKQMAALLVNGTSPYIGQSLSMSPELHLTTYLEHAAGLSVEITKELTVGGRIKIVNGMVATSTEQSKFGLTLADNYQITATGDFRARSSGLHNFNQSGFSFADERNNYFKNTGFGLDLGATYKAMDRLTVAASLVDMGRIKWKNNLYEYSLSNASYTFTGVDIDQLLDGNSSYMDAQMDSLKKEFTFQETQGGSFKTPLPGKMYLSGSLEVTKSFTVGALFFTEKYKGRAASGLSAMLNKNFGRVFSTSLSYTISNRSFNNLGAGLSLNFAPIQIYLVGDNLLRMPISLAANQNLNTFLNNTQVFTLRGGINIVWGWTKNTSDQSKKNKNVTRKGQNSLKNSSHIKARTKKR